MISVIYGPKGTGKTQRIIDAANRAAQVATGEVIYITDNAQSLRVDPKVRFVNLSEFKIATEEEFIGFLKGMIAANFDIQKVYIDGLCRLLKLSAEELKPVFETMEYVADKVDYIVTVTAEELPLYLKGYAEAR